MGKRYGRVILSFKGSTRSTKVQRALEALALLACERWQVLEHYSHTHAGCCFTIVSLECCTGTAEEADAMGKSIVDRMNLKHAALIAGKLQDVLDGQTRDMYLGIRGSFAKAIRQVSPNA